jgi:hypothetical protein
VQRVHLLGGGGLGELARKCVVLPRAALLAGAGPSWPAGPTCTASRATKKVSTLSTTNSRSNVGHPVAGQIVQRQPPWCEQGAQRAEMRPSRCQNDSNTSSTAWPKLRTGSCALWPQRWQNAPCSGSPQLAQEVVGVIGVHRHPQARWVR